MIIFLYGEDTFRSRQKLRELKDKFLREVDPSRTSLEVVDGEKSQVEKIGELIGPSSLFARKRMIIIENIFANKDQSIFSKLYSYLREKLVGENIIIFWDRITDKDKLISTRDEFFNFLKKQKYTQNFKLLSSTEVIAWTKNEVEARGGKINWQVASALTSFVGNNLWQIDNEINKLLSYKRGQEQKIIEGDEPIIIAMQDILTLVRGNFDENIFALTDAIGKKNKSLAMKLYEEQLEAGLADSYLLAMTIRQFKILLQIRVALDKGSSSRKIISLLKLHPFVVQKGINQVRNFTLPALKNILNQLLDIDRAIKTGRAETRVALNLCIAKL